MIAKPLLKLKENEKGAKYQASEFQIFYRKAGTVAWENSENVCEHLYLISGEAVITLNDEVETVSWPCEFIFPEKTYHKIEATTDIVFLVFRG